MVTFTGLKARGETIEFGIYFKGTLIVRLMLSVSVTHHVNHPLA